MGNQSKEDLIDQIMEYICDSLLGDLPEKVKIDLPLNKDNWEAVFYSRDSLRLTAGGMKIMKIMFESFEDTNDTKKVTVGDLLVLSKKCNAPFYVTNTKVVIFGKKNIITFKLCGKYSTWIRSMS